MVPGAVALSLSPGWTHDAEISSPAGLDRYVRPTEPLSRPLESMPTEPVQQGLERSLAVSTFRPLESMPTEPVQHQGPERSLAVSAFRPFENRLTEPVSQGLAHNTGRNGLSPRRPPPELASERSYWPNNFPTCLAKMAVTPGVRRTPCDERDLRPNGFSSGPAGSNGCPSLRTAFAELENERKQQQVLQQQLQQQQQQAHLWPRTDSSSAPGHRVQAETPSSDQPSTPHGQPGAASRSQASGYDDLIGTCTTIAVSGQPELSELVQAVHRLELKFAALRREVTAEISCQVRSEAASAQLYQQQQQQQQPNTYRSLTEAEFTKIKGEVEALQRGATRAATAQFELEARVEALRMQLLPCDLEAWRRRVEELEMRFQGFGPMQQGRDMSGPASTWRSSDSPQDLEEEQQAATKIQAIARGNFERKRIRSRASQHKIDKLQATVSSLQVAFGAAEDRFHNEVSRSSENIQHKLQLQLGEEFATFERRLKECEGRLLDEVSAASQAMTVAASSAAKVQDRVETLAADLSEDGGALAALSRRLDACEQKLPEVNIQSAELESFKERIGSLEDRLASEVQDQVVELQRESSQATGQSLEHLAHSLMAVESRIYAVESKMLSKVDVTNVVNREFQELNLPPQAEIEALHKKMREWEDRIPIQVRSGLENFIPEMWTRLDGRVRSLEDRHDAAQAAELQGKAATRIQARYRGNKDRHLLLERIGRSMSLVEVDETGLELQKHALPTNKRFKLLEKRLTAWEEQLPEEVQKHAKGCLDELAKQMPSKVEVQELVHTLLEQELSGWENRLAQFDAARMEVEALVQLVNKHQEHLDAHQEHLNELSADELKQLLESFVAEVHARLEGHNRDLEEAAAARQALIEKIEAVEAKLMKSIVDTVPDNELQAMLARCTDPQDGGTVLSHGGRAELGHRLREAQHSLLDRIEALGARLDGMYLQHADAASAQQALQSRVDSLQQAIAAAPRPPAPKEPQKQSEVEAWRNEIHKDLALSHRWILAEIRAETQLCLTDHTRAIDKVKDNNTQAIDMMKLELEAYRQEMISNRQELNSEDRILARRLDELLRAIGEDRRRQQAQVEEAADLALQGYAVGTPEVWSQPLVDPPTLETTTPPFTPPTVDASMTETTPVRQPTPQSHSPASSILAEGRNPRKPASRQVSFDFTPRSSLTGVPEPQEIQTLSSIASG